MQCVRLYVLQKLPVSLLAPRGVLPKEIDGIPTDVIESAPAFIAKKKRPAKAHGKTVLAGASCTDARRKRQRPVVAGISVAHHNVTAGTLAYFCRSTRSGDDPSKVYAPSNNHVFADVNRGLAGDDLYQPGPADGGVAADHFADLSRFVQIELGGEIRNRIDAAIGELKPDVRYAAEVCTIGPVTGVMRAQERTEVRKHGRTTGYTEGVVADAFYDALVGMDHGNSEIVGLFEDQMRIERSGAYAYFGLGGDSGSLVVHRPTSKAVGLYFAGPLDGTYGIANHIEDVLQLPEIELL